MPREFFHYLSSHLRSICHDILMQRVNKSTKHQINHGNLAVENYQLPNWLWSRTLSLASMQSILCYRTKWALVLGSNLLHQPKWTIPCGTRRCYNPMIRSILWTTSWIQWRSKIAGLTVMPRELKNTRNNHATGLNGSTTPTEPMSLVWFALKVGSWIAPGLTEYLHTNAITWQESRVGLGTNLLIDDNMWIIQRVDLDNDEVSVRHVLSNETMVITVLEAEDSIMK